MMKKNILFEERRMKRHLLKRFFAVSIVLFVMVNSAYALSSDTEKPKVSSMGVSLSSITLGGTVTVSYSVKDNVALKQVELWYKAPGGDWNVVPGQTKSISGKSASGSFSPHKPSIAGNSFYGIHVVDKAGNWDTEGTAGPKKIEVTVPKAEPIKVKIISPKEGDVFYISSIPQMPTIKLKSQIMGIVPNPTDISEFSWEGVLSYSWIDRNAPKNKMFKSFTFNENTAGGVWTPNFGDIIMGGNMKITVTTTIDGKKYQDSISLIIQGKNPDKTTVKTELNELKYQILAYKESSPKWQQFDNKNNPIFGAPSGYGLMQLDPPPSYREIWDWMANVNAGVEHFNAAIQKAEEYTAFTRDYYKGKEPVTDLSDEQILRQSYYSYNAGRAYFVKGKWWPYYVWDTKNDIWIVNKDASKAGKSYADDGMKLYNDIPKNKLPSKW